jgi:cell division septum initiation protein DivIVA
VPVAQPVEDWEHKYKTLQGVHNRHVGDLKQRIGDLEGHIAQLAAQARSAPATPQTPEVNPQDAETFGQDLVEMVRRTAEGMSATATRELQGRIAQLEQQLAGATAVASKTADEVFYERLAQLVPDWEAVNQHEDFLVWLGEVDPLFGQPRQAALTQAGNARDVNRVAAVFNTWKGQSPEKPKPAPRQEPQVSPRTSGNGAAQLSPEAMAGQRPTITIQAVEAFYKDVQRGLWRGREGEMAQQEAIINAALAENRIVDARQVPRQM